MSAAIISSTGWDELYVIRVCCCGMKSDDGCCLHVVHVGLIINVDVDVDVDVNVNVDDVDDDVDDDDTGKDDSWSNIGSNIFDATV